MAPVRLVSLGHAHWLLRILFAAHQEFITRCCHVSFSMGHLHSTWSGIVHPSPSSIPPHLAILSINSITKER